METREIGTRSLGRSRPQMDFIQQFLWTRFAKAPKDSNVTTWDTRFLSETRMNSFKDTEK